MDEASRRITDKLWRGILRKNASSDLQSNADAKVNLEHPHSPPPASLPFPEGGQSLPFCVSGVKRILYPDVALWEKACTRLQPAFL